MRRLHDHGVGDTGRASQIYGSQKPFFCADNSLRIKLYNLPNVLSAHDKALEASGK